MSLRIFAGGWQSPGGGSVIAGVIAAVIGNLLLSAIALIPYVGYVRRTRDRFIRRMVSVDVGDPFCADCKMCGYSLDALAGITEGGRRVVTCPECGHPNRLTPFQPEHVVPDKASAASTPSTPSSP